MSSLVPFKNTCIAMAACLVSGAAMANDGAQSASATHPLVQSVSNIFSKMQALPLQLLPSGQPASASGKRTSTPRHIPPTDPPPGYVDPLGEPESVALATAQRSPGAASAEAASQPDAPPQADAPHAAVPVAPRTPSSTPSAGHWQINPADGSVRRALQRWSDAGGWQLVWELPVDFPVGAQAAFSGGFEEAVAAVALSLQHSEMPMKAIFYRGNKVLRIVAKGAQ